MSDQANNRNNGQKGGEELPAAAKRALQEAAERRAKRREEDRPIELGGPKGAEPTRFGDWERAGRAVDF